MAKPADLRPDRRISYRRVPYRHILRSRKAEALKLDASIVQSIEDSIRQRLLRRFAESPYFELRAVRVLVNRSEVSLAGRVSTFYLKQLAQETTRQVSADHQIVNRIRVVK